MALNVKGYAAFAAKEDLVPHSFIRRDPRDNDVVIEILYSGVCHSDIHSAFNDWGGAKYPMVPGHEIIGRVIQVGKAVSQFRVGDYAGVGCMVDSCQRCTHCKQGLEQYCEEGHTLTYNDVDKYDHMPTYGGYSEKIVVNEKFVIKIPENMDLKSAAPLLCAGITTWSPLRHWNVGRESKVAVVGLGGLGHMAIKLAKALGAEVTLFSRSPGKEADARHLGAGHFVISTDEKQMQEVYNQFDLIIDTVPYVHDLNPYIQTLALNGTLVLVGYLGDLNPMLNSAPLILGRKSVAGSVIGGITETQELIDFCAKHQVTADVELIKIQDINSAWQRMLKSDVKYRFVIDMSSLKA